MVKKLSVLEQHFLWPNVVSICQRLQQAGFQAVLAGGCVRDALLGVVPKDFDIATDAKPQEVMALFAKTIPVGLQFGIVRIIESQGAFEVATFRRDGSYADGRHPQSIEFSNMHEDAKRRDFTVNALFYDPLSQELYDFVGGIQDLANKVVRAVGDPRQRFGEDKLRILRAVRFVSQLGFALETETKRAIVEMAKEVQVVAKERIQDEFRKLLITKERTNGLLLARDTGVLKAIWPHYKELDENNKHQSDTLKILSKISCDCPFAVSIASLHVFEQGAQTLLNESLALLKCSRADQEFCLYLVRGLHQLKEQKTQDMAPYLRLIGHPHGPWLVELYTVFAQVKNVDLNFFSRVLERYKSISDTEGSLPKPLLTGQDLLKLNIPSGPKFREILDKLYDLQLNGQLRSREMAIEYISTIKA